MNRDTTTSLTVGKLIGGGVCLAHHDGATWMVRGALPGERVNAKVVARRAGVVEADTIEVVSDPHGLRVDDPCPHAGGCGGCDWPFIRGVDSSELKPAMAAEAIRSHPELAQALRAAPITSSPERSRLRARLHWEPMSGTLGFLARRSHRVEAIPECRVLSPTAIAVRPLLETALAARCPEPVEVEWLEDLEGAQAVIGLRAGRRSAGPPPSDWLPRRNDLPPSVVGAHVLSRRGARPGGWGEREVVMNLPIPLTVPLGAFFQGNRHLVPTLFRRVSNLVGPAPAPTWDLHAGVGFLAAASRHAAPRPLVLCEPSTVAAEAARRNLPGATVHVGATAERTLGTHPLPADATVLLDPPRSGLTRRLIDLLVDHKPTRILMMSCDVATWARDVQRLGRCGFDVDRIELFDLFPLTHHVEVLSLLVR